MKMNEFRLCCLIFDTIFAFRVVSFHQCKNVQEEESEEMMDL